MKYRATSLMKTSGFKVVTAVLTGLGVTPIVHFAVWGSVFSVQR